MPKIFLKLLLLSLTVFLIPASAFEDKAIRIFISADMEGLAGAVQPAQISNGGMEYQKFREVMTAEVLAAIEGAKQAGATEFVVADSHGSMQNLLIDRFPDDVTIVRGSPRPLGMMEGVQNGHFDGVIFIGYHASSANTKGVRAHSFSSASLTEVNVNGLAVSEGYFNAGIAGDYGVPVIMVSGDEAATEEVRSTVGDMEVAVVKQSISFHAAITMTPKAAQNLIREKAKAAVSRIKDFKVLKVKGPLKMQVTTHFYRPAELLAYLPSVKRIGARTIEFEANTFTELSKFKTFMSSYSLSIKP